jgi:RNA polymerase sigma-70 factor (ECF subfamily)
MGEAVDRREQLAAMVEEWLPGLYAFVRRLGLPPTEAEDVVQDSLLAAWRSLPRLRDPAKMRSWLFGIAYRHFLRSRRRHATLELPDGQASLEQDPSSDGRLDRHSVRRAVLGLPELYREPLVLVYWQELSYQEAAEVLRVPLGTLSWRLHQALSLLREALTEEKPDEP